MQEKPRFSIIIPAYNAEKYIRNTIERIIEQNYEDYELILINDGSKDLTGKICDEFSSKYVFVKTIHVTNGGASRARNIGLENSRGEYILFCDADDYFVEGALKRISDIVEQCEPDSICFGWQYVTVNGVQPGRIPSFKNNKLLDKGYIYEYVLPPLLNLRKDEERFIYDFAWNKVYKKSILVENNIKFNEKRRTWEDRPFVIEYLKYCKDFFCIAECLYNYVQVEESLSLRYSLDFFEIILENHFNYKKWFGEEYDFNTQYVHNYWCHSIENMILRSLKEKENKDQIKKNIEGTLSDNQVITWYKNREPENELEKKTSNLISEGKITEAIKVYENVVAKQLKQEKWNAIKAKVYSVRKVFK